MQALIEFSSNKSCPELSNGTELPSDSLSVYTNQELASSTGQLRATSFPLLNQSELDISGLDLATMTTTEDDAIEILSCQVDQEEDIPKQGNNRQFSKVPNGLMLGDDLHNGHRKRVARAIGVVTFLLLLFSVILIGISLNMSKNIDEMAGASPIISSSTLPTTFTEAAAAEEIFTSTSSLTTALSRSSRITKTKSTKTRTSKASGKSTSTPASQSSSTFSSTRKPFKQGDHHFVENKAIKMKRSTKHRRTDKMDESRGRDFEGQGLLGQIWTNQKSNKIIT